MASAARLSPDEYGVRSRVTTAYRLRDTVVNSVLTPCDFAGADQVYYVELPDDEVSAALQFLRDTGLDKLIGA